MRKQLLLVLTVGLFSGISAFAQPVITAVQDAGAYSANIAQGSVFVVKGTSLSASGYTPAGALPLATTLNNVRITFTPASGGAAIEAFMVYTYNLSGVNQLAAVLPSTAAAGNYDVRVINGGATSAAFRTNVVARKFGIITQDSSGTGNAVVQNFISSTRYDVNRLTSGTFSGTSITYSPTKPGQVIVIWGTGLGPVLSGGDNVAPGAQDFRARQQVRVIVGGVTITPDLYAGRAPEFPGTDEIILTLPANVPTGCDVPMQVSVDGQLSNPVTIAIAPAGGDACVSSLYSRDTLVRLDQGGSIVNGTLLLSSLGTTLTVPGLGSATAKVESIYGTFTRFTGAQLGGAAQFLAPNGSCQVFRRVGRQDQLVFGTSPSNLDAGAALTLSGPNVVATNNQLRRDAASNSYYLNLGTALSGIPLPPGVTIPGFNASPIIGAGTYTIAGTGGADVGAFTARVTLATPITVATLPTSIPRNQPLRLTWTGGAAGDQVQIVGTSGGTVGGTADSPIFDAGVFFCTGANTGNFTVPVEILAQLPPTPTALGAGIGAIIVSSNTVPSASNGTFTAPLVAGGNIDSGLFVGTVGALTTTVFQ